MVINKDIIYIYICKYIYTNTNTYLHIYRNTYMQSKGHTAHDNKYALSIKSTFTSIPYKVGIKRSLVNTPPRAKQLEKIRA